MQNQDNMAQLNAVLGDWNTNNQNEGSFDPVPSLNIIAELLEKEVDEFYKLDPDPLDFQPPDRQIISCQLGKMMKVMFSNGDFMATIVDSYLLQESSDRDSSPLFTASCRVMLDLLPGFETSMPFRETEGVLERLCNWAEFAEEPLQSYATGLLSGAILFNDVTDKFREKILHLVPIMLDRLHAVIEQEKEEQEKTENNTEGGDKQIDEPGQSSRHFAVLDSGASTSSNRTYLIRKLPQNHEADTYRQTRARTASRTSANNHSNSSGAEMNPQVIGSYLLSPLTVTMKQRLIFQFLTNLGDYHELLSRIHNPDRNAMALIFHYINLSENKDIRLAFEALRFLSVILCHKKCAIEFINKGGIQKLLEVPRSSMAANGVSLCFSHITRLDDVTEQLCMLPKTVLNDVVSYNLDLMECSHNSSRGHACLFFSQSFTYKVILNLFDQKDGLRQLINVLNILRIFSTNIDDKIHSKRQVLRHVCDALRKYFEVHTTLKANELRYLYHHTCGASMLKESKSVKGCKFTLEENMDILLEHLPPESNWDPEWNLHKLGGQKTLCQLLAMREDSEKCENYPGKKDIFVSALDVIAMCAVSHRTQLLLCGTVGPPYYTRVRVMSVIINLVEGKIISDAEIMKAALRVIVNSVCGPKERFGSGVVKYRGQKGKKTDLLSLMWDNVQTNTGVMVLLKTLSVKIPITEADWMRMLACKALVGMARSKTIRKIIDNLPPLNNGQLHSLMKEPVSSDKHLVHHQFCKYASILIAKKAGRQANALFAATVEEIRKASVVAQTKITYPKEEMLQLIHNYLSSENLHESAKTLQKEANLPECPTPLPHHAASMHLYSPSTSEINKQRYLQDKDYVPPGGFLHSKREWAGDMDITLDTFVTEHLRNQHALCPQPISTCPTMSLFIPHRCSQPLDKASVAYSITQRLYDRQVRPLYGGSKGRKLNRHYIHSKLSPLVSFRDIIRTRRQSRRTSRDSGNEGFSCCKFDRAGGNIFIGTQTGNLRVQKLASSGNSAYSIKWDVSFVAKIAASKVNPDILITSSGTFSESCALWEFNRNNLELTLKYQFEEITANFANQRNDRFIGTTDLEARIYDISTGTIVQALYDEDRINNYELNMATFNPTDDLVLNDGNLWDVRSNKIIYKFDKLNKYNSGCFHPRGLEVLINSEIWDLRTFGLLHTVPALDKCHIIFNSYGDVIYALRPHDKSRRYHIDEGDYSSTFCAFDALDYQNIGTFKLKTTHIYDIDVDQNDLQIAVIQNASEHDIFGKEALCHLYELGKNLEPKDQLGDTLAVYEDDDNSGNDVNNHHDDEDNIDVNENMLEFLS